MAEAARTFGTPPDPAEGISEESGESDARFGRQMVCDTDKATCTLKNSYADGDSDDSENFLLPLKQSTVGIGKHKRKSSPRKRTSQSKSVARKRQKTWKTTVKASNRKTSKSSLTKPKQQQKWKQTKRGSNRKGQRGGGKKRGGSRHKPLSKSKRTVIKGGRRRKRRTRKRKTSNLVLIGGRRRQKRCKRRKR